MVNQNRLRQILFNLINLINNAVKYTIKGKIRN